MKRSKDKKAIRAGMKFLADTLDKLPDDEAVEIFNAIMVAYDEAAESQPSAAPAYDLAFVLAPAMTTADPGRPSTPLTLAQLIADPTHLARVEAILRSKAIKRPSNVAHLVAAIEELKWTNWQIAAPIDFYKIATHMIGKRAGTYNTYKSALNRAHRVQREQSNRQKNNENYATANAIQRYKELLQADEI